MNPIKGTFRNLRFLKNVYTHKGAIRSLLESGHLPFIRSQLQSDNLALIRTQLESKNRAFIRFAAPGHFYSPIPDLIEIDLKSAHIFDRSQREIPAIELNEHAQIELAKNFALLYKEMPFPDKQSRGYRFYLDNLFFSYGDGIILYCFLRHFRPKRIVEVGSGFSSAAMLDTSDRFLSGNVEFTFIEPFPDRLFGLLSEADKKKVRIEKKPVQDVDSTVFGSLETNDILFIDSSHVAKIHSDVLHIVFHVLPRLKKGVIIHFHDILWPFEYPKDWLEEGRAWNEAYFLRSFLQYNLAFEVMYFNSYFALHHADFLEKSLPDVLKTPGARMTHGNSSLWIRKVT